MQRFVNRLDVSIEVPNIPGHPLAGETIGMDRLAGHIMGVSVANDIRGPGGQWELTFTQQPVPNFGQQRWPDLIPVYSKVRIKLWRQSKDAEQAVMLGLAEAKTLRETYSQAAPQRTRSLAGKSLAGVLSDYKLYMLLQSHGIESDALLGVRDQLAGVLLDPDLLTEQQPADRIIGALLDNYIPRLNLRFLSDASDLIRYDKALWRVFDADAVYPVPPIYLQTGSLWSVLQQYQDPTFHEMFTDTDPSGDYVEVVFRKHPFTETFGDNPDTLFDVDALNATGRVKVATEVVEPHELIGWNLTRGTANLFNLFWVLPQNRMFTDMEMKAVIPPSLAFGPEDPADLGRFGVRAMEARTPYMPRPAAAGADSLGVTDVDGDAARQVLDRFASIYQRWSDKLRAWHRYNVYLYSGSVTIQGRASVRVGDRLIVLRPEGVYEFYVEGVRHDLTLQNNHFVTTCTVSRGYVVGSFEPTQAVVRQQPVDQRSFEEDLHGPTRVVAGA